ncbi:MAG: type I asparaginase [Flavobacteriaceae bacterium]|nr:type I asparaginase [Flavobacteriaceae bacterium]
MTKKSKILLIYTGGTIGMVKDYESNALKVFNFEQIKEKIPELNLLDCIIYTVSFENPIDSSNMNPKYWVKIVNIIEKNYNKMDGFVVLTGTDTMSYTSSAISFMFENLNKPGIFTGSQLPIGDLRTDAKENLITAIQIAAIQENNLPKIGEVCLYFEYKLYRANRTTKISSEQFDAFNSPNFPPLGESGVHLNFNKSVLKKVVPNKKLIVRKKIEANVVILKLFPGINEQVVQSILEIPDLKGVILETYGAGNAPTSKWFINLLKKNIQKNIFIINVTQCVYGSVLSGLYETSNYLKKIGVIDGKDITTESALAKLKYLIGENIPVKEFKNTFETPLRGEMS